MTQASSAPTLGAVLIDYQNLHHYLKNRLEGGASVADAAVLLVRGLLDRLAEEGVRVVRATAIADFPSLEVDSRHIQRTLYLSGIRPVYVPHTMHRNTSDMQLALEAAEIAERYPELATVALVGGDRDYIPAAQALLAAGRRVHFVGFREHLTPYLLAHTGGGLFIDAAGLMPGDALSAETAVGTPIEKTVFQPVTDLPHDIDYDAIEVIERFFGQYDEIYLTPLLRRLSEEIGDVDGHDPKSLVADLEASGAARLERRRGMPYDYTVLIVNEEHPAVLEIREELREEEEEKARQRAAQTPAAHGDDYAADDDFEDDFEDGPEDELENGEGLAEDAARDAAAVPRA
ncbi:MAG: NYN domain-containing protein [Rubricoccaceae bacterium]